MFPKTEKKRAVSLRFSRKEGGISRGTHLGQNLRGGVPLPDDLVYGTLDPFEAGLLRSTRLDVLHLDVSHSGGLDSKRTGELKHDLVRNDTPNLLHGQRGYGGLVGGVEAGSRLEVGDRAAEVAVRGFDEGAEGLERGGD